MKTTISAVVICLLFSVPCLGQTISVSFAGDNAAQPSINLTAAETAGVVPVANWNADAQGVEGSIADLMDSDGAATGASVSWSGANNTWGGTGATTPDEMLVNGWLDDNGDGATINVTGIPYETYDVIVYGSSDDGNAGRGLTTQVNGTDFFSGGVFETLSDGGTYFSSSVGFVDGASAANDPSFFSITGLSGDLTIFGGRNMEGPELPNGTTDYRAAISGFQITNAVPEPASISMVLMAFIGMLGFRRRK